MKPTDGQNVAFICWESWPRLEENKKRALKNAQIHVGTYREGRIRSNCRCHGPHMEYDDRHSKVFLGRVDTERICKFCFDEYPSFWHHLHKIEPPLELEYFLIDLSGETDRVTSTTSKRAITNMLIARPEYVEDLNKVGSKLWLIKGYLVEVDLMVRKIVEGVTIKEE